MSHRTIKAFFSCVIALCPLLRANVSHQEFIVRPGQPQELQEILDLDRRVTFEFFKPVFVGSYSHLIASDKVDDFLNLDLIHDAEKYPKVLSTQENERLHVAYDTVRGCIAGYLFFYKEQATVHLDLLMVDKNYRRKGIGRKLIQSARDTFDGITTLLLHTLQHGNDATLRFYESLGFKKMESASPDLKNEYGIHCSDLYFYYKLDV